MDTVEASRSAEVSKQEVNKEEKEQRPFFLSGLKVCFVGGRDNRICRGYKKRGEKVDRETEQSRNKWRNSTGRLNLS